MRLIERSISHHKRGGLSKSRKKNENFQPANRRRPRFYVKTKDGKNHREEKEFTIFFAGYNVIFLFFSFSSFSLPISNL